MEKSIITLKPDTVAVTLEGVTHKVKTTREVAMMCLTVANALCGLEINMKERKEPTQVILTLEDGVVEFSFASGAHSSGSSDKKVCEPISQHQTDYVVKHPS